MTEDLFGTDIVVHTDPQSADWLRGMLSLLFQHWN